MFIVSATHDLTRHFTESLQHRQNGVTRARFHLRRQRESCHAVHLDTPHEGRCQSSRAAKTKQASQGLSRPASTITPNPSRSAFADQKFFHFLQLHQNVVEQLSAKKNNKPRDQKCGYQPSKSDSKHICSLSVSFSYFCHLCLNF